MIGWVARYWRTRIVERYIEANSSLLDIGCGDGYFLHKTKCKNCIGIDKMLGDNITEINKLYSNYFDYITMLAVVEHIEKDSLKNYFDLIYGLLKPKGRLIITTPCKISKPIINFLYKSLIVRHKNYFNFEELDKLLKGKFILKEYHVFAFGFNQLFYYIKNNIY